VTRRAAGKDNRARATPSDIAGTRPITLTPFFLALSAAWPQTEAEELVLMHNGAGDHFVREDWVSGKQFPRSNVDLCWGHMIP
jgi:hypothetical protein